MTRQNYCRLSLDEMIALGKQIERQWNPCGFSTKSTDFGIKTGRYRGNVGDIAIEISEITLNRSPDSGLSPKKSEVYVLYRITAESYDPKYGLIEIGGFETNPQTSSKIKSKLARLYDDAKVHFSVDLREIQSLEEEGIVRARRYLQERGKK